MNIVSLYVRYPIYCNDKKEKYSSKYQRNNKIMRISIPTIIPLLIESNIHLPL
jgi:hypothetical protein